MGEELDLSRLTAKRDELLSEVKAEKAKRRALEQERDEWKAKADAAQAKLRAELIDKPVDEMLADMFLVPFRHVKPEISDHFDFVLDDAGKMQVMRKDGEPAMIGGRPAEFTRADMNTLLSEMGTLDEVLRMTLAQGAGGVYKPGSVPNESDKRKPSKPAPVAGKFGLR